ncbi:MAG: hypothetical protein U1F30_07590 [Steroidobacteraceae bacterium]
MPQNTGEFAARIQALQARIDALRGGLGEGGRAAGRLRRAARRAGTGGAAAARAAMAALVDALRARRHLRPGRDAAADREPAGRRARWA